MGEVFTYFMFDGKLRPNENENEKRKKAFSKYKDGDILRFELLDNYATRSYRQNRDQYRHYKLIAEETGYDVYEIDKILKEHFREKHFTKYLEKNGKRIPMLVGTSDLNTVEHSAYLEDVRRLAADHWGINIPEPNQSDFL